MKTEFEDLQWNMFAGPNRQYAKWKRNGVRIIVSKKYCLFSIIQDPIISEHDHIGTEN